MKVLSLSLDPQILNAQSVVASRSKMYGLSLERYDVVVPSQSASQVELSSHTTIYGTGGKNKLIQFWCMYKKASQLLKTHRYDVITSQDTYFLGLLGFFLATKYHMGLEVQVLGIEKLNFIRKKLSVFVLNHASSIRVLSLRLKKRLVSEFGIREDRMMLVPIFVDVSSLGLSSETLDAEHLEKLHAENEKFRSAYGLFFNVISVNRLVPIKNLSMQLEAIEILSKEFPNILLHIVGDGPLQHELENEIEQRGIQKHVVLEGYKAGAQLAPFFTESDCFVLTSNFEGYGMVVIEAATAGLPIVMTDVGCAGEVIVHEKSGMIVPPKDVQAFVTALRRILSDTSFTESLGKGAKEAIAELPSFDTVLGLYKASWQMALENKY